MLTRDFLLIILYAPPNSWLKLWTCSARLTSIGGVDDVAIRSGLYQARKRISRHTPADDLRSGDYALGVDRARNWKPADPKIGSGVVDIELIKR